MAEEKLTKVLIDLPNGNGVGGESLWAVELGDDLFELRNTPFHAYGLNFGDVVRACAEREDQKPVVLEVVRHGGHHTLRIVFLGEVLDADQRLAHLEALQTFGATYEGGSRSLFSLDVEPTGDLDGLRDALDALAAHGVLDYETTERRDPASFDDLPQEGEP